MKQKKKKEKKERKKHNKYRAVTGLHIYQTERA
jgi:hypothetical protein